MHWPIAFKPGKDTTPKDENGKVLFDETVFTETYAVRPTSFESENAQF